MNPRALIVLFSLMKAGILASGQLYIALPIAQAVSAHFHVAGTAAALVGAVFGYAYAVGFLFWGPASDWMGRDRVLLIGTALSAVSTIAAAYAPTFPLELIARMVQGFCCASIAPAGIALVSEMFDDRWRPTGQSMMSFSFIAATPVAQLYAQKAGLDFPALLLLGSLGFGGAWIALLILAPKAGRTGVHRRHPIGASLSELFHDPVILTVWSTCLTVLFGFVSFQTQLTTTLSGTGWSQVAIRLFTIMGMLTSFVVGLIIRKTGDLRALRAGLTIEALSLIAAPWVGGGLPVIIVIMSVGIAVSIAGIISTISRRATHATRGMAIAVYSFCLFTGASTAPLFAHLVAPHLMMTLGIPAGIILLAVVVLGLPWMKGPVPAPVLQDV